MTLTNEELIKLFTNKVLQHINDNLYNKKVFIFGDYQLSLIATYEYKPLQSETPFFSSLGVEDFYPPNAYLFAVQNNQNKKVNEVYFIPEQIDSWGSYEISPYVYLRLPRYSLNRDCYVGIPIKADPNIEYYSMEKKLFDYFDTVYLTGGKSC